MTNNIGIEGIHAERETVYFHCDDAQDYNTVIRKLCSRQIDTGSVAAKSKEFIKQYFNIEKSLDNYISLCKSL